MVWHNTLQTTPHVQSTYRVRVLASRRRGDVLGARTMHVSPSRWGHVGELRLRLALHLAVGKDHKLAAAERRCKHEAFHSAVEGGPTFPSSAVHFSTSAALVRLLTILAASCVPTAAPIARSTSELAHAKIPSRPFDVVFVVIARTVLLITLVRAVEFALARALFSCGAAVCRRPRVRADSLFEGLEMSRRRRVHLWVRRGRLDSDKAHLHAGNSRPRSVLVRVCLVQVVEPHAKLRVGGELVRTEVKVVPRHRLEDLVARRVLGHLPALVVLVYHEHAGFDCVDVDDVVHIHGGGDLPLAVLRSGEVTVPVQREREGGKGR